MILAIETSAEPASLALLTQNGDVIERQFVNQNKVNVPLADQLSEALHSHLNESIQTILVGAGPGSYSGARVGLATAEALGILHECPVITLSSLNGVSNRSDSPTLLIGDARRKAYFLIQELSGEIKTQVLELDEFMTAVEPYKSTHRFVTFEPASKLPLLDIAIEQTYATASGLIRYWQGLAPDQQETHKTAPTEILYLRPPNITKAKNPFV